MQDPNFLKYVEYFNRLPTAKMYYYFIGKNEGGASATEISKRTGRAIQTVTNALRSLEREGLLTSEKKGRVRIYNLKDPRLYRGLIEQTALHRKSSENRDGEDIVSVDVLKGNLKKWLEYLAEMLDGKLYDDRLYKTNIIDVSVDFVIENRFGQYFLLIFHIYDVKNFEASIGVIMSLLSSKEIIPNLTRMLIIGLVYDPELANQVQFGYRRLNKIGLDEKIWINDLVKRVKSSDLLDPNFSKKLGVDIAQYTPYNSDEALPGEDWMSISDRRSRAMSAIQDKVEPQKGMIRYVVESIFPIQRMHELKPRDEELKRWIDPDKLLASYGVGPGDVFVDILCFEGLFSLSAIKLVDDEGLVYGVDLQSPSLENLRSIGAENNIDNLVIVEGTPEKVMIDKKIADYIFYGTVLSSLYDPYRALLNAHQMLKDEGKVLVLDWREDVSGVGPSAYSRIRAQQVYSYLESAGFEVESIRDEGEYLYSIIAQKKK